MRVDQAAVRPRHTFLYTALAVGFGALVCLAPGRVRAFGPPESEPGTGVGAVAAEPFPLPPGLRSAVQFWRDLFTLHTSERVVVHDRESMELVWRVIVLPKDEAGVVDEVRSAKLVKATIDELRQRLRRLAGDHTALDEEDRVLLALAGDREGTRLAGAAERLRAQRGVADKFAEGLARARVWAPSMREVLASEGVPADILVLPFVESMFNPLARSYAGAAGLWQLMPATARGLGLKVKGPGDERLDVLKATRAAARMLRSNYRMLGSWPLAITAYNHGPNGVRRAVNLVGSMDLAYLIDNYERSTWGFASKNFYAEFLAALAIVRELPDGERQASVLVSDAPSVRY